MVTPDHREALHRRRIAAIALAAVVAVGAAIAHGEEPAPDAAPTLAPGVFLVARDGMVDPRFRETVILIVHHDASGALGIVVNRRTDLTLANVFPETDRFQDPTLPIYVGGPVLPQVGMALIRTATEPDDSLHVMEDLYLTTSRVTLEEMLSGEKSHEGFRLYLGHSGWGPGQLERECARGDWQIVPARVDQTLPSDPAALWSELSGKPSRRAPGIDEPAPGDTPPGARWTGLPWTERPVVGAPSIGAATVSV